MRKHESDARIIWVDDRLLSGPADGRAVEREQIPDLTVEGERPFIFARNVNLGIKAAGDDDVIVLGDDALLETPGGFTAMQRTAEEFPEFGVIASTCNNTGNRNQWRGASLKYGAKAVSGSDVLREDPRMVCFICVLIPRRTIKKVGLLDERFVDYGCDDDDYCKQVIWSGLKIGIYDGCYVDHGSLKSSFRGEAGAGGDFQPNLRRFISKWGVDNHGHKRETSSFPHLFPNR